MTVLRHMERNPLQARLVERAEDWRWSSLRWLVRPDQSPALLEPGTLCRPNLSTSVDKR